MALCYECVLVYIHIRIRAFEPVETFAAHTTTCVIRKPFARAHERVAYDIIIHCLARSDLNILSSFCIRARALAVAGIQSTYLFPVYCVLH